ncbi:hypothetical protein ABZ915_10945 [Streptomyces sp. NPDC046915]|uniref:hypothetical protein n=1 Tax=Streptomyces sp. NPDC046915 TaxID=3155257 RepID=UPI0033CD7F6B
MNRPGRQALRVLVLLLALSVPGTQTQAVPMPSAPSTPPGWSVPSVPSGETVEHDLLESALRPPSCSVHRAGSPLRPAPLPDPAPGHPRGRPLPAPPRPPHTSYSLRSVVLRC